MVIGFWKRLLSDFLDAVVLALFGFLLSLPLSDLFYDLGDRGIWIGLVICFFYTGLLQSSLGQGQSLAKKVLGIQVLSLDGSYLTLPKSFLRYLVIALIAYNQAFGQLLKPLQDHLWVGAVFLCLVVIFFLGCFLMVPLHPLKRGLHDLLAGSIVVKKGTYDKALLVLDEVGKKREKLAYRVWGLLSLLALGGAVWFWLAQPFFKSEDMKWMFTLFDEVSQKTAFRAENVSLNSSSIKASAQKTLIIRGYLPKKTYEDKGAREMEVQKVAQLGAAWCNGRKDLDGIVVVPIKGYSIGIWSFNEWESENFNRDGKKLEKN